MQLTIHLFSEAATYSEQLLRDSEAGDVELLTYRPLLTLDFECIAAGAFRPQQRPAWADYLDGYFDIDWRGSVASSLVLLPRVADRFFAVTFGYGRHLLQSELLVHDFGLRVTANTVAPEKIRSMASVALDVTSRRTVQQLAVPGSVEDFTVDLDLEWVRSLGGWTEDDLTRGMTGSQSLVVNLRSERSELKHLDELLGELLARYRADEYKEHFGFIDALRPLPSADQRVPRLDAMLTEQLRSRTGQFGIVAPDSYSDIDASQIRYSFTRDRRRDPTDLDILRVRSAVHRHPRDPLTLRIRVIDGDGHVLGTRPLRDYISAEIDLAEDDHYVLAAGRWFHIDADRLKWLERRLGNIPEMDITQLDLPQWWTKDNEESYNRKSAEQRDWVLLDRKNFLGTVRHRDKVEICDLLTEDMHLVCVKRLRDAMSLSHLFAQGSVSATLYHRHAAYRKVVHGYFRNHWSDRKRSTPTVVYAIGTDRRGPLTQTLPFFSRLNLCNHVAIIRDCGLRVAIARIDLTHFETEPTTEIRASMPEQRAESFVQGELFQL